MVDEQVVLLSRILFAVCANYHYLFVPLTLGLSFLLALMESIYVITGKEIYKDMTKFWGKLFGINFAMGVATGITLEFQFGTNWSYYSHYVGDIFGTPLAIEGLMAFFLESTFIGMFFFGWDRLSKRQHLVATWLVFFGSSLSALWIIIANGWMQTPIGSYFNPHTLRMEVSDLMEVMLNPAAQIRFAHTTFAGYTTGAMFMIAVSSYYLLKKQDYEFAIRSLYLSSVFGVLVVSATAVLGHLNGLNTNETQPMKLAAMEAHWETGDSPSPFNVFVLPNMEEEKNDFEIGIPYLGSVIVNESLSKPIRGIKDVMAENEKRIRSGMIAYEILQKIRAQTASESEVKSFYDKYSTDLGYGLLLKRYTPNIVDATDAQIKLAVKDTVPNVAALFWSLRLMVALGMAMLLISMLTAFISVQASKNPLFIEHKLAKFILLASIVCVGFPWLANTFGWFLTEYGRQPWTIYGILPTFLSTSALKASDLYLAMAVIVIFYTFLFIVEVFLMVKYVKLGPSSLATGRYHFEKTGRTNV